MTPQPVSSQVWGVCVWITGLDDPPPFSPFNCFSEDLKLIEGKFFVPKIIKETELMGKGEGGRSGRETENWQYKKKKKMFPWYNLSKIVNEVHVKTSNTCPAGVH